MDNSTTSEVIGSQTTNLAAGIRLPKFKRGKSRPNPFSASDMNVYVSAVEAFLNFQCRIGLANQNQDGAYTPSAKFTVSNSNSVLDLFLAPPGSSSGGSSVTLCQVQSFTTTNKYFSVLAATATGTGTYTTSGSPFNVALPAYLRSNPASAPAIDPPYTSGDIIIATQPTGGTGVFVSGTDVGYADINFHARRWQSEDYFTLSTMFANYFTATSIISGSTVAIAKNPELRNSITGETIDTVSWVYTYQTTGTYKYVTRKADATIGGNAVTEYQVIVPRYLTTTGVIKARQMTTGLTDGSSNPILWQEVSGREWAARSSQAGYENV